jgi:hypothetical protein
MFAIIRTKRIKNYTQMSNMFKHNLRQKYANNIDAEKSENNKIYIDKIMSSSELKSYYKELEVQEKSNNTLAIELVLTASPEFFKDISKEKLEAWKNAQVDFLKAEYGKKLKFLVCHEDETSPHFHAVISLEERKIHKYKNQRGEFFKEKTTLNSRHFNREYLINLQTKYAEHNKRFKLNRGMFNSRARHKELKEFQAEVKKSLSVDYDKNIEKAFDKALQDKKKLGYINYNDVKAFHIHTVNNLARKNKNLKTALETTKQYYDKSKKANEVIAKEKDLDNLRVEYFDSVNNHTKLKNENAELTKIVNEYKDKEEKQAQKKLTVNIDNKLKVR